MSAGLARVLDVIVPGAAAAGAAAYVQRRAGAGDPLVAAARAAHDPDAFVARLAAAPPGSADAAAFSRLRAWAWEGLLADPAHGTNQDRAGWARFGWTDPRAPADPGHDPGERPA